LGSPLVGHFRRKCSRQNRTSEFPSASKPPSYMMDGMIDRPTKITFAEMRDMGVRRS
jgi:hypothetical protein